MRPEEDLILARRGPGLTEFRQQVGYVALAACTNRQSKTDHHQTQPDPAHLIVSDPHVVIQKLFTDRENGIGARTLENQGS